ncbi:hypothetical protein [Pelagicoccus sp. SDUM812002]|uniref:hypothetical protein n=1 Tax=Pelagicoccus sp. SDUM812002 TaxID=3041266 RepID=UPI00280DE9EB|nr:hypothetical protein [Pelagicoccus sp. SDUM812002]MDQ8187635.1 hypothetical protein [Pelagicoccus sp. SDUM812002]
MAATAIFNLSLRLTLVSLVIVGAYLLGDAISPAVTLASRTASEPAPNEFDLLPSASTSDALRLLEEALESGNEFLVHYTAAYLAKRLDVPELSILLDTSSKFQHPHNSVARVILGIELAYRSPETLASLLKEGSSQLQDRLDTSTLFRYFSKSHPESAFDLARSLEEPHRGRAFQGIRTSENRRAEDLLSSYQHSQNEQRRQESYQIRRDSIVAAIKDGSYLQDPEIFHQEFVNALYRHGEEAFEIAQKIDSPEVRFKLLRTLLNQPWEPSSLKRQLDTIANYQIGESAFSPSARNSLYSNLLKNSEPELRPAILDWLETNLTRDQQNSFLPNSFNIATDSPLEFLNSPILQEAPPSVLKNRLMRSALAHLASEDLDTALDFLTQYSDTDQAENLLASLVVPAFQNTSLEVATTLYRELKTQTARQQAIDGLANTLGRANPVEFVQWASQNTNPQIFDTAIYNVAYHWANQNPEEAAAFAENLPASDAKRNLQINVGRKLSQYSPLAAIEYGLTLEDSHTHYAILNNAAFEWAKVDPKESAQFFVETLETPPSPNPNLPVEYYQIESQIASIFLNTAEAWSTFSPEDATRFFALTTNQMAVSSGFPTSFDKWVAEDESAALDFITKLDTSRYSDGALSSIASSISLITQYPEIAYKLAAEVSEPEHAEATRITIQNAVRIHQERQQQ